jgi:hypothetical protein
MFETLYNLLTKYDQPDTSERMARAKARAQKAQSNFAEKTDKVNTNVAEKNGTDTTVANEK